MRKGSLLATATIHSERRKINRLHKLIKGESSLRREVARTGVGVVPVPKSPFLLFVLRGRRAYLNIPSCLLADNSIHLACAHSITKEIFYFCHMVIILFSYNWKVYRGEGRTKTRCFLLLSLWKKSLLGKSMSRRAATGFPTFSILPYASFFYFYYWFFRLWISNESWQLQLLVIHPPLLHSR